MSTDTKPFVQPAAPNRDLADTLNLGEGKLKYDSMQQTKQMQHSDSRIAVAAAICVWVASAAAHAGAAIDTAAQVSAPNISLARSAQPLKRLTLTAPQALAISGHRPHALGIGGPRQMESGRESAPQLTPVDRESKVAFPIQWQRGTAMERVARNYKYNGVPLVHLSGAGGTMLAIGVSPRGVPGIYFTQKVPD